jgi:hypothetical protein
VLNSLGVSDLALGGSNSGFGTARDVVGIVVLWALGWAIETVSDAQKARRHLFFRTKVVVKTEALIQLHYKLNKPPKNKPFTVSEPISPLSGSSARVTHL